MGLEGTHHMAHLRAQSRRHMEREFGTRPEDLIAAIGPSICRDCYEVSEEVAEQSKSASS